MGLSTENHRQRIIEWLRQEGSLTTLQARDQLDIFHPAARIQELRDSGFEIVTSWAWETSDLGGLHRVARYTLLAERAQVELF